MKVINLNAGPGAGKSTAAAALFVYLKNKGLKVELAHEVAKDFVYQARPLDNQLLLLASQYDKLLRLKQHDCQLAISDSPLRLSEFYGGQAYTPIVRALESEFMNINVLVKRTKPYIKFGRVQTEEEAKTFDEPIEKLFPTYDLQITGDAEGQKKLCEFIEKSL